MVLGRHFVFKRHGVREDAVRILVKGEKVEKQKGGKVGTRITKHISSTPYSSIPYYYTPYSSINN